MDNWRLRDKDLTTKEEITARIYSIRRRIDEIASRETRSHRIDAFERKNNQIAKLNSRLDALLSRLAALRKEEKARAQRHLE